MSTFLPVLGSLLLAVPSLHADDAGDKAIAAVMKFGGKDYREAPAHPITGVHVHGAKVTDADLKELAALEGLKSLQGLGLSSTNVTDADLKELAALEDLRKLSLWHTTVGDARAKELAALKGLDWLDIG